MSNETQGKSGLTRILQVLLILFLALMLVAGGIFVAGVLRVRQGVQQAGEMMAPVQDLMRQLVIPATPVILPSPTSILRSINDEARLITLSANYEKVMIAERNNDVLWGALGEKLIFVANGTVVAGVDLAELSADDILVVDPDTVMVRLPQAEIFDDLPVLNNELSYVADRDTGLLTRADPELETQVRRAAEAEILEVARGGDLLERANVNAQQELQKIIEAVGFREVLFFADEFPPVTPYAQEAPKGYVVTPEAGTPEGS
ncbi:MAG: DUF4230 domain-containing protein [Anaerolineales bacterium]|nr:DUF4230 domain-containing protein [Anaerolineales bacterium]